jgi:hypothetical protein
MMPNRKPRRPVAMLSAPLALDTSPTKPAFVTGSNFQLTPNGDVPFVTGLIDAATLEAVEVFSGGLAVHVANLTPVNIVPTAVVAVAGTVSASGDNTVITPASGKRLNVGYLAYNPESAVEARFKFPTTGTTFLRNKLTVGGAVIAKDFGAKFWEGAINEALVLNLSAAVPTIWNAVYVEV